MACYNLDECFQRLRENDASLTEIDLWNAEIGDKEAVKLAKAMKGNKTVQELWLEDNQIGNKGAIALAESFRNNKTLQKLDLSNNEIGDEGAIDLAEAFRDNKTLQMLDLYSNQISDKGATALLQLLTEPNTTLTSLRTWGNEISDSLIQEIDSLVGANVVREPCRRLRENDIMKLDLSSNAIGNEEALILADAMKGNTFLEEVYLQHNWVGNEGTTALATTLQGSPTLKTLDLSSNWISNEGATALATTLQGSPTLETLDLSYNKISNEGATALATTLQGSPTLKTLNLSHNWISNEGATSLANGLGGNTILQSLNLGENDIGSDGAMALATALIVNRTLKRLNLVNQLRYRSHNERMWTRQTYEAFLDMSCDNLWVQVDIHLPPDDANALADEEICQTIRDMLTQLRLNACGRGRLEQGHRNTIEDRVNVPEAERLCARERSNTQDWIIVLFRVHNIEDVLPWSIKLNCIYTLVRKNPNLCPKSDE